MKNFIAWNVNFYKMFVFFIKMMKNVAEKMIA